MGEQPPLPNSIDHLFSQTMVGLDDSFASSIAHKKKKIKSHQVKTDQEQKSYRRVWFQQLLKMNQRSNPLSNLFLAFKGVPCTTITDHVVFCLERVQLSSVWQAFRLPSSYGPVKLGAKVRVPFTKECSETGSCRLAPLFARTLGGCVTGYGPDNVVLSSEWMPRRKLMLLAGSMVGQDCLLSGLCVEHNKEYVLYRNKTDDKPEEPIVLGQPVANWTKKYPFKNRTLTDILAYVHTFNPGVKGSIHRNTNGDIEFRLHNFDEKDLHYLRFETETPTPLYQTKYLKTLDTLDMYMIRGTNTSCVHAILREQHAYQTLQAMQGVRNRATAIIAGLSLIVLLIVLGLFALLIYRMYSKQRVRSIPRSGSSTRKQPPISRGKQSVGPPLTGGKTQPSRLPASAAFAVPVPTPVSHPLKNPLQTLSVMIDTLQHRVENL